jgi:Tol biopolymer transport system component
LNLVCTQAFSPATRRLACEGWSETDPGLQGIYTVCAADGGDLVRVTRCSQDCRVIGFSPDGSRIFFFQAVDGFPSIGDQLEGSLFVISTEGTDVHRITHADTPVEVTGNSGGRLTPDGARIVFHELRGHLDRPPRRNCPEKGLPGRAGAAGDHANVVAGRSLHPVRLGPAWLPRHGRYRTRERALPHTG